MTKELQDLAWSILPKEFKEEVKELYAKFYNEKPPSDCSYGYLGLLIKIFGIHNLTANTEQLTPILPMKTKKNKSDYFNHILEMNTEVERRKIAVQVLQGLVANTAIYEHKLKDQFKGNVPFDADTYLADMAVVYADALIAELNKKKDGN